MRRLVLSVIVASGLVMAGASSASAEPAGSVAAVEPAGSVAAVKAPMAAVKAAAAARICRIQNSRLTELSGLVATDDGFIAINDGSLTPGSERVFYLDDDCSIVQQVSYSGGGPRDTEDMVLSADGKTLWIADIGDNDGVRETVGLWKMPASGSKRPVLNRLTYPDGAHDAEAMLLNGDGTPIIVTKDIGKAGLYVPSGPLEANTSDGVRMRRVGEVDLPASTTSNPLSAPGRLVVTGGAVAPDGSRVVLRTYADAFEFDVTGGDVLAALKGTPRATPLPNEPQGEAITYSADGRTFLTASDMQGRAGADNPNYILRYTPTAAEAAASVKSATTAAKPADDGQSWLSSLSLDDITYLVGGVGLLGAVLVGLGIFGIMRSRRRPPAPSTIRKGGPPGSPHPTGPDAATALMAPVRDGPGRPGGGRPDAGGRPGRGGRPGGDDRPGDSGRSGGRPGAGGRQGGGPQGGGSQRGGMQGGGIQGGGPQRSGMPGGVGRPSGGRPTDSGQGRRPGVYGDSAPPVPQKGSGVYGGSPATGRPGPGGVYGAPPAGPPPTRPAGPPPSRPSGFFGGNPGEDGRPPAGGSRPGPASHGLFQPGAGHPGARQQGAGMNTYADVNGLGRGDERFGNPGGYGRSPRGR